MGKNLLQTVYLFKGMTPDQLELISEAGELKTYGAGDDIFSQGDSARALYVLQYGSVKIHQKSSSGDNVEISTLGSGSHFGEMAMVDGEPRSASATAIERSDIVVFDYQLLKQALDKNPATAVHFYRELAHFLCGRLRITTNDLSFSREKNLSHF